jgi:AcrR family transcriptional regulator
MVSSIGKRAATKGGASGAARRQTTVQEGLPEAAKRRRPGGRTERNRKRVAGAVLRLLQDGKLNFEIQDVVALSGVHRTTIFRRWPDRATLMAEALTEHVSRFKLELTGDWRTDLRRFGYALRDFFAEPVELAMNRTLAASGDAAFQAQQAETWLPVIDDFRNVLSQAQAEGKINSACDCDVIIMMLMSTILTRSIFNINLDEYIVFSRNSVDAVVDQLILSCVPAPSDPGPPSTA